MLIDSGVNVRHPHIAGAGTVVSAGVVADGGRFDPDGDGTVDRLGHGTAAAAAILDLAPGARIGSLKVFFDAPTRPFPDVLAALAAAIAQRPKFVALPLGTPRSDWDEPLLGLIAEAAAVGVRLVAPASFGGISCRPGGLRGVLGVIEDASRARERPVAEAGADGRTFWFASPYPKDAPGIPRAKNFRGPSFATANVVGHLLATGATGATGASAATNLRA